jgi:hypothetical protein
VKRNPSRRCLLVRQTVEDKRSEETRAEVRPEENCEQIRSEENRAETRSNANGAELEAEETSSAKNQKMKRGRRRTSQVLFQRVKQQEREADKSPSSSVEIKNSGVIISLSHASSWRDV